MQKNLTKITKKPKTITKITKTKKKIKIKNNQTISKTKLISNFRASTQEIIRNQFKKLKTSDPKRNFKLSIQLTSTQDDFD